MESLRLCKFKDLLTFSDVDLKSLIMLEAFAFEKSCEKGSLHGIPVWTYGTQVLFETDKPECHLKEQANAYYDAVHFIMELLKINSIRTILSKDPLQICNYDMNGDQAIDNAFNKWQRKHLDSIKVSKQVLEETMDTKDSFIHCPKCKSNSVDTEQKQTRSADEPMTIFCTCRKCKTCFRID